MSRHKRKGRAIDHCWKFCKYKGDISFYAKCSCGFLYPCYKNIPPNPIHIVPAPEKLFNYCPHCGARKTRYYEETIYIDRYLFEN